MNLKEKVYALAKERGVKIAQLEKELGMAHSTILKWETSQPSGETLGKVADYFDVSVDFLLGRHNGYYTDPDVVILAQALKDRPEMRVLFDASRDVSATDLEAVIEIVKRLKKY